MLYAERYPYETHCIWAKSSEMTMTSGAGEGYVPLLLYMNVTFQKKSVAIIRRSKKAKDHDIIAHNKQSRSLFVSPCRVFCAY